MPTGQMQRQRSNRPKPLWGDDSEGEVDIFSVGPICLMDVHGEEEYASESYRSEDSEI